MCVILIYVLLLPAWLPQVIELDFCIVRFHLALVWGLINKASITGFVSSNKTSSVLQVSDFTCTLPKTVVPLDTSDQLFSAFLIIAFES